MVSDSLQPHGLQPTRFLCPWNFPGKNTRVGCHFLLQGIFLSQGLNSYLLCLCIGRRILYHYTTRETPPPPTFVCVCVCVCVKHSSLVVVANGLSHSMACGIFPDQGSNLYPLHCKADSYHWTTREVPYIPLNGSTSSVHVILLKQCCKLQ